MKLNELLATLVKRFPEDAWSAEVGMIYVSNGKRKIDAIHGVGYVPVKDTFVIALIGEGEIERVKQMTGNLPEIGKMLPDVLENDWSI